MITASGGDRSVDWTQFWPDMIVALFTGVVVGLVLLGLQRAQRVRAERRNARRTLAHGFSGTEQTLASGIQYVGAGLVPSPKIIRVVRKAASAGLALRQRERDRDFPEFTFIDDLAGCLEVMDYHGRALENIATEALKRAHGGRKDVHDKQLRLFFDSVRASLGDEHALPPKMTRDAIKQLDLADHHRSRLLAEYRRNRLFAEKDLEVYLRYVGKVRETIWFASLRSLPGDRGSEPKVSRRDLRLHDRADRDALRALMIELSEELQDLY